MRVAIVGSRSFTDRRQIEIVFSRMISDPGKFQPLTIVSGGARGADSLAEQVARANHIPVIVHLPEWERLGKRAGFVRNELIVRDADMVIAFFADGPKSKGTMHTVRIAVEAGKPVYVYHEGEWARAVDAPTPEPTRCERCGGTGRFITGTLNGQPVGPGGICFRCGGKGVRTEADDRRNYGYDNFYRRIDS